MNPMNLPRERNEDKFYSFYGCKKKTKKKKRSFYNFCGRSCSFIWIVLEKKKVLLAIIYMRMLWSHFKYYLDSLVRLVFFFVVCLLQNNISTKMFVKCFSWDFIVCAYWRGKQKICFHRNQAQKVKEEKKKTEK